MSITVGSVGDIIALIQLAASVKKCLSASRGSSADFQGVVELMDSLEETLLATQRTLEGIDDLPRASGSFELLEQRRLVLAESHRCRNCISGYMKQIQKYGKSLSTGGSKNALSDIFRKLQWGSNEKSTLERFRQEVQMRLELLNLQSANLSRYDTVQTTFQEASEERRHIASNTESHLIKIEMRLDCVMPALTNNSRFRDSVSDPLPANNRSTPTLPMDDFWIWDPLVVRILRGRQFSLPLGLISGWGAMVHAFNILMKNAYCVEVEGSSRLEYYLHNPRLRRHIDKSQDFDWCFQAGELLDMTIVFVHTLHTPVDKSLQPSQEQIYMQPSHEGKASTSMLDQYVETCEATQAFMEKRALLGPAIFMIFAGSPTNRPARSVEYLSIGSIDESTRFGIHQSGLTQACRQLDIWKVTPLPLVGESHPRKKPLSVGVEMVVYFAQHADGKHSVFCRYNAKVVSKGPRYGHQVGPVIQTVL